MPMPTTTSFRKEPVTATDLREILADALEGAAARLRQPTPGRWHEHDTITESPPLAGIAESTLAIPVAEVAKRLNVSRGSVYESIRNGQLQVLRIGRRTLVPVQELRRWVAERSGPWTAA
jgi:excisionase family DNA binding protein